MSALAFSARKHRDQRRKDAEATPYINHPIALVNTLVNEGGETDTVTICAALLHDTIEDTDTTPEELRVAFGAAICDVVLEVTDDTSLPSSERKALQVAHAPRSSHAAKLVKLADKISNLRDLAVSPPPNWSELRRQRYFDWARDVVAGLRGTNARLEAAFDAAYRERPD
ncbi:MAG: HD domain-containing protein [Pseudomonadota bacterium]